MSAALFQYFKFFGRGCQFTHPCGPNQVYWSLSLEEQFYFVLPFVIALSGRHLLKILIAALVVQIFMARPVDSLLYILRGAIVAVVVLIYSWKAYSPALIKCGRTQHGIRKYLHHFGAGVPIRREAIHCPL